MARFTADIFCEDSGHEAFITTLLARLVHEEGVSLQARVQVGRGGAGRVLTELTAHQVRAAHGTGRAADLLIVLVDANCVGWSTKQKEVQNALHATSYATRAIGCPDPHVERWLLADPQAFKKVVGTAPPADPGKCEPSAYKKLLNDTFAAAKFMTVTGPMEAALDIVPRMKLSQLPPAYRSLNTFVKDLRNALRQLTSSR